MNLPILPKFFQPKTAPKEFLYALEIGHHQVKSAIWTVDHDRTRIVCLGPVVTWDDLTQDSLNLACDRTISEATELLDKSASLKISKVIFSLPPDWLDPDKILPPKRQLIKNLSYSLDLNAVGFVVTPEAVVTHLKNTEKVQTTAIIVGISPHFLDVTLAKLGRIIQIESVRRSHQPAQDVAEGLSRIAGVEMFPSRILLYDSKTQLEPIRQSLLSYPWQSHSSKLPFLHYPKVEILPPHFSLESVVVSGGGELAQSQGMFAAEPDDSTTTHPPASPPAPTRSSFPPDSNGKPFSVPATPSTAAVPELPEVEPESLGFTIENPSPQPAVAPDPAPTSPSPEPVVSMPQSRDGHSWSSFIVRQANKISLPAMCLTTISPRKIFLIAPLVLVALGLFAAYWFLPIATIVIQPQTQVLNHEFTITVNTSAATIDESTLTIPGKILEAEITQSESLTTTTTKLVGDKATGTVDIINGTAAPKKFPVGTVLSAANGLKFLTAEEVEVASASGSADPNSYKPGKAAVKVVAEQIGPDSNLTAGTQFRVGSFSSLDFIAKNEQAFSGGSSRQAKVVTREDQAKLRSQLTQSTKEAAKQKLLNRVSAGEVMVEPSVQLTVISEEFSKKVDEISDDLTLKQTAKATGFSISQTDVDFLAEKQLLDKIPDGFTKKSRVDKSFAVKSAGKNSAVVLVKLSAEISPQIDIDEIRKNLVGKSKSVASEYLSSLNELIRAEIIYSPPLPDPIWGMPKFPGNIRVLISPSNQ